ncbi:MAG: replicative DNA helicase [Tissierellia bacterium]|nr:replicative DNA helicase [Tissierellia bacterium]
MSDFMARIPPHNEEAEQFALGIILVDNAKMSMAIEMVAPDDFYNEGHKFIYQAIINLYSQSSPADLITVSEELRRIGKLEAIGGITYLGNLTAMVATTANIEYYLKIIKEKSILRALIEQSAEVIDDAYKDEDDLALIVEKAERGIFEITQGTHRKGLNWIYNVLLETFKNMEERAKDPGALRGVPTGFIDLDNKLSGLQKSDFVVLAARPSMGKTAFMVNIALNAVQKEKSVAMFSLEMSEEQLAQRMISSMSHVNLQNVISGDLSDEEWRRVLTTMTVLGEYKMYVDDTAAISPLEIKAKCRRIKAEAGLDLIVIDYLQLMQISGSESRQQEISAISRNLKAIAKELEVPVMALSQLSRAPEKRENKRPVLSDLRESGAIEQDADVVMFLYRDDYYNPETEKPNVSELIIAKHRNGPIGTVELLFRPEFTKFVNMQRKKVDESNT